MCCPPKGRITLGCKTEPVNGQSNIKVGKMCIVDSIGTVRVNIDNSIDVSEIVLASILMEPVPGQMIKKNVR